MASLEASTFDSILASFQKRLSPQDLEIFRITTYDDLKFAISSIQKEQAARKGLRNLNKIRPFINGLNQYSQVLEVFVQVKPEILAFIWGPIKLCLQIASKLKEAFDILLDAYEKIGASLPIISAVDTLFRSNPYVKQILADVFEDILDFHKRAIVFFKQPTWKLCLKTTYQPFTLAFEDILKKLDRSRDLLLHSANIAHFQESQEARTLFTKEFQVLIDAEQSRRRLEVMESLSTEQNFVILHEELRAVRAMLPQTTRWIYSEPEMINWLDRKNGGFWICGIPGAGKTVIFNSIADEISTRFPESQLVYFYCKNNDPFRSNFVDVARSLIAQILHLNPSCLDFIYEAIHKSGELRPKNPSFFLQVLKDILLNHDSLYIGIDGLDECPEKDRQLLSDLIVAASTAHSAHGNVKIFLTSRKEKDLDKSLGSIARFNIKPQSLESDITAYICMKVSQLSQKFSFSQEREQSVSAEICTRPKGMFLLARLIMDNLLDQDSLDDLNEELKSEILPRGIDEAYERMLIRIGKLDSKRGPSEKRLRRAKFILQLIITARRDLFVHEIQGALAISLEKENIDFEGRYSTLPLDELCGPIIQIHKNDRVEMIHPTAKEYLWQDHSKQYINHSTAKETMAAICTSYLTFNCFHPDMQDNELLGCVSRGEYAFQEYAVCNWLYHLKCFLQEPKINALASSSLWMAFKILSDRHENQTGSASQLDFSSKMDILNMLNRLLTLYDNNSTILPNDSDTNEKMPYLLRKVSQSRLFIEDQITNAVDSECLAKLTKRYGESPFRCPMVKCPHFVTGFTTKKGQEKHCSSHQRLFKCTHEMCDYFEIGLPSEAALKTHLNLCHEIPRQDQLFPSIKTQSLEKALHDAIVANDLVAVAALATELASFTERETGFILQALTFQHKEAALILLQLLGTTSEINHVKKNTTALLKACEIGDENFVNKLLERGANINIGQEIMSLPEDSYPLSLAAKNGHIAVIKALLGHKDLDLRPTYGVAGAKGALTLASIGGFLEIVSLLLEVNSEYFTKYSRDINKALKAAIRNDKVSTAELLLQWVLDKKIINKLPVKIKKISGENINKIIEVLTQQEREVDEKGGTRENLLQAMAHKGDVAEVSRLLDLGADIENNSGEWGTPLMAAASTGKLEAIKLLIDRGANVMTMDFGKNRSGGSAIDYAAVNGHEEVARHLLAKGCKFTLDSLHRNNSYGTRRHNVLQMASQRKGLAPTVRFLLEQGADVNAVAAKGDSRSPLMLAAKFGDCATCQVLLDYGADINALSGETALMAVVSRQKGSEGFLITQTLTNMGANIDMIDKDGDTALIIAARTPGEINLKSFRHLLEKGADISIRNSEGHTVLMRAIKYGSYSLIKCLLKCKSDYYINEIEEIGDALNLAVNARTCISEKTREQTVNRLLDFSRNIDREDGRFNTALSRALSVAKLTNRENIVKLLLEHGAVPLENDGAAQN